ncbi:CRISPR-associated helicase Cas3' [uncultured Robinsoniella sp.]|uniref:CRISPR-associated helicase Cas3' n=1 Tax=uncultured Robinsoniella sp. TaxID=904190 RepID=UPI00374F886A
MLDFININEIINDDYPLYAHKKEENKEKLTQHIQRCQKYFERLENEKELSKVIKRISLQHIPDCSEEKQRFIYKLFCNAIFFHDFGKLNPAFQIQKMKNNRVPVKTLEGLSGTDHSLLSAVIYLDYYLEEITLSGYSKNDKSILILLVWINAYAISRHHSDLERMEEFTSKFLEKDGEIGYLLDVLEQTGLKGYNGLRSLSSNSVSKSVNKYLNIKQRMNREQDIIYFFYMRYLYSVLVACDYYATTDYMEDVQIKEFGTIQSADIFREPYECSELLQKIRNYEKERTEDRVIDGSNEINNMRSEMFLDAEAALRCNPEESIYFLESPTGSGKSNTAMNLGFQMLNHGKKIYYIYPFNTLVEQNRKILQEIFHDKEICDQIVVVNSLLPIKGRGNVKEDSKEYYQNALLDRQFLNYPFILSTHVSFFDTLFSNRKESVFSFLQLTDSVVILDEIQSYKNTIWAEIMIFLRTCAKLLGMKIIMMSATLPGLDYLAGGEGTVTRLIQDRKKYFYHPLFRDRVQVSYELLNEKMTMDRLFKQVLEQSRPDKKLLITFIKRDSAYEFFDYLTVSDEIQVPVCLITGDDSMYEREKVLKPIRDGEITGMILVSTQVIEAGVDIDMDIGFKDISKLDSEEQFLGRINRSCKRKGMVYFFDMDNADRIYGQDYRIDADFTLKELEMRAILKNKEFDKYYKKILEVLKLQRNESTSREGLDNFFSTAVKLLDSPKIAERMRLIDENHWNMNLVLCRTIEIDHGEILDGWSLWEEYVELLRNRTMEYSEKQIKLSDVRSKLNNFIYQVKWNPDLNYSGILGELYCIQDGEEYFENGKLNRKKLESKGVLFVDL